MREHIELILDTTVLRAYPTLQSEALATLSSLTNAGTISVHVPWIVAEEWRAAAAGKRTETAQRLDKALQDFRRISRGRPEIDQTLGVISEALERLSKDNASFVDRCWDDFVCDLAVLLHDVGVEDTENVFDAYFRGGDPFPTARERTHIPDAFIFQCASRIAADLDAVSFISADNNLRTMVAKLSNVTVYSDLDEFLASDSVQAMISALAPPDLKFNLHAWLDASRDAAENQMQFELQQFMPRYQFLSDVPSYPTVYRVHELTAPPNIDTTYFYLLDFNPVKIGAFMTAVAIAMVSSPVVPADQIDGFNEAEIKRLGSPEPHVVTISLTASFVIEPVTSTTAAIPTSDQFTVELDGVRDIYLVVLPQSKDA